MHSTPKFFADGILRLLFRWLVVLLAFLLSACIPDELSATPAVVAASPIPTATLVQATPIVVATITHTNTAAPSRTPRPATPTPKPTETMPDPTAAIPEGWLTYTDLEAGFSFAYPPDGALVEDEPGHARIDLPMQPGTNLQEKYLEVDVLHLSAEQNCSSPFAAGYDPQAVERETVDVSGESFTRESGAEGAAGSTFEWVAFSTTREQNCISLTFVLHSTNTANYEVPPTEFDPEMESTIFEQILATIQWTE